MVLSICGLLCDECEFFGKSCMGCEAVKGSTFWAKEMMPGKVCPLYACSVNQKGFRNCGECNELPCATFIQMKDPKTTDEEHQRMLKVRTGRLRVSQ